MIRVLIADDQPLIRAGIRGVLDLEDDLLVVGEVADGQAAVRGAHGERADIVLMDIRMPGLDGIEATRRIRADENLAGVRIIILTTFETDDNVAAALHAGASGFLGKGASPDEIVDAIRIVANGEALLSARATRSLIERFLAQPQPAAESSRQASHRAKLIADLTEREREVLVMVARGLSNEQIGEALSISSFTVKTHVNRAMVKLDAHDRAQLVVFAYQARLLQPDE
ncbi:MAG: response regulator transcription factor [Chloroflexota bacterium]|nr:response regulator transcription factor [Chloroflexota bacterium]MDQ3513944.1 response regulator transcription factor [Chloroflexota bacterium]